MFGISEQKERARISANWDTNIILNCLRFSRVGITVIGFVSGNVLCLTMNYVSENCENYLFVANSEYLADLYKLCLQTVNHYDKLGRPIWVVIFFSDDFNFKELSSSLAIDKEHLKRFISIKCTSINEVTIQLMKLWDWDPLPALVVVDIAKLIKQSTPHHSATMKKVALCSAILLNYLNLVSRRKEMQQAGEKKVKGVFIVEKAQDAFEEPQLQLLKELYYYRTELLENFNEIQIPT